MSASIRDIMNPGLGVQDVLESADADLRLPGARPLATGAAAESGLADLYRASNLQSRIMAGLQPPVPDESLLRPDVLRRNLADSLRRLRGSRDPHVRRFVRDDLEPLLENGQLLREYVDMLVSG